MTQEPKSVSLRPVSFTDDAGLLDLSLQEVVSLMQDVEKRRRKDAKDNEDLEEAVVGCRCVPMGLMMALDGNARRLGISRAMLTKCASHQIVAWLGSQRRIQEITGLFNIACDAAEEYGYPDLYDSMAPNYMFASSASKPVCFRTIEWVRNKLYAISQPVGVPIGALFIVGLCYSLTRTGNETKGTIIRYLSAEVQKFTRHVDERAVWVVGFNDLVRRRAKDEGLAE